MRAGLRSRCRAPAGGFRDHPLPTHCGDDWNVRRGAVATHEKDSYLVNTARGGIVDEGALHAALTAGTIAGAGIDVLDPEPPPPDHPLLQLANFVTSPHMAGVTRESIDRMGVQAAYNVLSIFDGKPIRENAVNPAVFD